MALERAYAKVDKIRIVCQLIRRNQMQKSLTNVISRHIYDVRACEKAIFEHCFEKLVEERNQT